MPGTVAQEFSVYYPGAIIRITATVFVSIDKTETQEVVTFVSPRDVTIERNDYTTADTCTLKFTSTSLPFLPRNISQALVQVYVGDLEGIGEDAREVFDDAFLRFIGYIDHPSLTLSESENMIEWKARDYTALFLDYKRPSVTVVPSYADRLDQALRRIVDAVPGGENISLVLEGLDAWPDLGIAAPKGLKGEKIAVKPDDTLWHYVKRACDLVGLIPEIRLDTLVVHPSRGAVTTPLRPYFCLGWNVGDWSESRDLQRLREGIGLTAFDHATGKYIFAVYPPDGAPDLAKKTTKPATKKAAAKAASAKAALAADASPTVGSAAALLDGNIKRRWFAFGEVSNAAQLEAAAERVYKDRSRQEWEGQFTCRRLLVETDADPDDPAAFDMLALRSGDRVIVDVLPAHRSMLGGLADTETRTAYLVELGYDESVAAAVVRSYESGLSGSIEVYVRKATAQLSESGFTLKVDFQALLQAGL